jgi:hypothetical protein
MAMTPTEAAAALSDIETTTRRGMTLRGYRTGGPILMLWSVIWAIGYLSMGLLPPQYTGLVWLPLDVIGIVGSILLSRRALASAAGTKASLAGAKASKDMTWRMLGGMGATMAFVTAVFSVFQPTDPAVFMAFPGLLIGVIYAVIGVWVAPRYIVIGAVMFVLTLVGFFVFKPWLAFWMASASIALFVSGLWLRKA